MSKQVTIAVIGRGKVGSSFARRIAKMQPKYSLLFHLPARRTTFPELARNGGPEVIFICAKDDEIVRVAKKTMASAGTNLKLIVHCAGSRESTILPARKGIARLTLHPMQTFAKADPSLLQNIHYMVSTGDAYAKTWARKFVREIGGNGIIEIPPKDVALYHTLVVFASNFTTLIGGSIEMLSKALRISPQKMKKAVTPLMQRSLENVLKANAATVLTGPLARSDYATILKHRKALRTMPPALKKIYEGFVMLSQEIKK